MAAENHYRGKIACRNSTSFSDCHFQAFPVLASAFPPCSSSLNNNNNNMYIYHALFNAPSAHRIRIDLNTIFYTHVEHRPTKTIYIRYYMETRARARTHTHARTHARTHRKRCLSCFWIDSFLWTLNCFGKVEMISTYQGIVLLIEFCWDVSVFRLWWPVDLKDFSWFSLLCLQLCFALTKPVHLSLH